MITQLEGVNTILRLLGEAPVASIATPSSPLTAAALAAIESFSTELCARSWFWNTHLRTLSPGVGGTIPLAPTVLAVLPAYYNEPHRYTIRAGLLYDTEDDTNVFTEDVELRVVENVPFDALSHFAQAYVVAQAAVELAGGLADQSVSTAVAIKYRKAEADFMRQERPPGRYSILDPATRYRLRGL